MRRTGVVPATNVVGDTGGGQRGTSEQFAKNPLRCPPETQVGVLNLYLTGVPVGANYGNTTHEILPVFNLEPRKGKVAELGFPDASDQDAVPVRIVAKARTNSDFTLGTLVCIASAISS